MRRAAAVILLALLMGLVLSLVSAFVAAGWSNIDSWPAEQPIPPSRAHLPAYLRGHWSDPVAVTTNAAAAWGVSQTTITCEDNRIVMRSSFGWPARCMGYDMFSLDRPGAGAANLALIAEASARAGLANGRPFPAWAPVDRQNWMGPGRLMPLAPRWTGHVTNTLAYGAVIMLVAFMPRLIRRERRRRLGLCERCGYPAGVSDACTECGATLSRSIHGRFAS